MNHNIFETIINKMHKFPLYLLEYGIDHKSCRYIGLPFPNNFSIDTTYGIYDSKEDLEAAMDVINSERNLLLTIYIRIKTVTGLGCIREADNEEYMYEGPHTYRRIFRRDKGCYDYELICVKGKA